MDWKCGNCGKIYNTFDIIKLKKIKMVESDIDPKREHGYTVVCDCGYRFHLDRWRIDNIVKIKVDDEKIDFMISTIFLEYNHKFLSEKDEYYETAILWSIKNIEDKHIQIIGHYDTKENAIEGHNRILDLIKDGKYQVKKIPILGNEEYRIEFEDKTKFDNEFD